MQLGASRAARQVRGPPRRLRRRVHLCRASAASPRPTRCPSTTRSARSASPLVEVASRRDPAPSQAASAGVQSPLTLQVKAPKPKAPGDGHRARQARSRSPAAPAKRLTAGTGKVRLFAHPGNPDARAAARRRRSRSARAGPLPPSAGRCARGSVVSSGTVLGSVSACPTARRPGHLRFAVRPAGDPATIDPGPVLANWAQLQSRAAPAGSEGGRTRCSAPPPATSSCSPRPSCSAPCSPTRASRSTRAAATTSPPARSTSACWRCSLSSRAAA